MLKKIHRILISSIFAFGLLFILGCQKQLEFDGVPDTPAKCVGCDYLPVCDSAKYVYVDSSASGKDSVVNIVRVFNDTTVNGKKFSKVNALGFFDNGVYYNCDAQEYKILFNASDLGLNADSLLALLALGLPIPAGSLPSPGVLQATLLKTNVTAGTKWKDVLYSANLVLVTLEVSMQSELVAKNISRNVLGKNYSDVMQVKTVISIAAGIAGTNTLSSFETFYAKGTGIIEESISDEQGVQLVRKLYSYTP